VLQIIVEILVNIIYLWCCLPVEGNQHLGFGKWDVEDPFAEMVPHLKFLSKG